ncbi:MAG: Flp family type IVb pilin [Candidatus Limnocylindrales bacterium]
MVRRLVRFLRSEQGQGLAEYALILVLIAVIAILAVLFLGSQIRSLLSSIGVSVGGVI